MPSTKSSLRASLVEVPPQPACHGRLGQYLRRIKSYPAARQLFISPAPILAQLRINALLDGKDVIMPAPGLKDGFYLLKPYTIPFPKLPFAVTAKGLVEFGRRLDAAGLGKLSLDMLIAEALAVDEHGARLGDGKGFFDLSCAIFAEYGALGASCLKIAALDDDKRLVAELPHEDWDVWLDALITSAGIREFTGNSKKDYVIRWDKLPEKRIKKITPIWDLWRRNSL